MSLIYLLALAGIVFLLLRSVTRGIQQFRRNAAVVSHIPGYRIYFHPHALFSAVLPRLSSYFNIGEQYTWRYKHDLFQRFNSDLISVVSYSPQTRSIITCDPEAIKFIVAERKKFMKPLGMYAPLAMFGQNVGVSEGAEWVRHKKIVASSNLLENINQLAWENTMKTMELCFEDWESKMRQSGKREIKVESVVRLTLKLALFVILGAGFSAMPEWDDDSKASLSAGHVLSFRHALHGVLENVWWKIALPKFAYKLPFCSFFRHVGDSFEEFGRYLEEMVRERRELGTMTQSARRRQDLLGALIQSSEESTEEKDDDVKASQKSAPLTDREVMGNIYVFLLAGHDTTAHTLAFTFGLLALYPEIQQELYRSVTDILPSLQDDLTYEKTSELQYALAVFMETLRIYPSVVVVPKYSMENTLVPVSRFSLDGGKSGAEGTKNVLIPQWAEVMIDVPGLHYNPRYWGEDAKDFRPSRFIDDEETGYRWPREAFMGFSQGARACLGQKFAQVEAVTIIAEIIRRFEVEIDPSVLKKGESTEAARRRLLDGCKTVITLTPKPLPVIFRERKP